MAYGNIFFDLDGTLCDPGTGITKSVQYALSQLGIEEPNLEALHRFVGPPLEHSFEEYYNLNTDDVQTAVHYYREYFGADGISEYTAYTGIQDLLHKLTEHAKSLAVVTSKPSVYAEQVLRTTGLRDYFDFVAGRGLEEVVAKAVTLKKAVDRSGADPSSLVMVGDRKHDIIAARENKIDSIGVLYGYGTSEELTSSSATHIVKDVSELGRLLVA